jgi:hypothetical protein
MSEITILHHPACGTSRHVLERLPNPQRRVLNKKDGEAVVDAEGRRVVR